MTDVLCPYCGLKMLRFREYKDVPGYKDTTIEQSVDSFRCLSPDCPFKAATGVEYRLPNGGSE